MNQEILNEALRYLEMGFSVIPVGIDKKPLIEWKKYQAERPAIEQVRQWSNNFPEMNIGIVTGSISRIAVIDIEAGGSHDRFPRTAMARSGGGGWHLYYKHPGFELKNAVRIGELTDIRGDGGYVVAPPSLHQSGNRYEWINHFGETPMVNFPQWILAEKEVNQAITKDWPVIARGVGKGSRNTTAASYIGKILHDLSPELWDSAGWAAAVDQNERNSPPLPTSELQSVFESIKKLQSVSRNKKEAKSSRMLSTCLADIKAEPINWLWPNHIALGKITLIAGDPGLGKSLITAALAATVSKGYAWPLNGQYSPAGSVVLLSAEDDPADTIRPRLDAADADCGRIHVIKAIEETDANGETTKRTFSFKRDIAALKECIASLPDCKLVVIDPVSAYLDGTDGNSNSDIRGLFTPLAELAAEHDVAIVLIQHLNKSSGGSALYRPMGSLAFIAAARAAFIVTKDQDNPQRRLFMPAKNNIAKESAGLAYSIMEAENGAPVIAWEPDPVTITADEALLPIQPDIDRTITDFAIDFLKELLSRGPVSVVEVDKQARQVGITGKPLRLARCKLGIKTNKSDFNKGWVLSLPEDALKAQDALPQKEGAFAEPGYLRQDDVGEITIKS